MSAKVEKNISVCVGTHVYPRFFKGLTVSLQFENLARILELLSDNYIFYDRHHSIIQCQLGGKKTLQKTTTLHIHFIFVSSESEIIQFKRQKGYIRIQDFLFLFFYIGTGYFFGIDALSKTRIHPLPDCMTVGLDIHNHLSVLVVNTEVWFPYGSSDD